MKHPNRDDWQQYINGQLEDKRQESMENHLYECEVCLDMYMDMVEASDALPEDSADDQAFINSVMREIRRERGFSEKDLPVHKGAIFKKTAFHYVLAASLTIILMSAGVFQKMTTYVEDVYQTTVSEEAPSITEQIMNRMLTRGDDDE